jgi:hypothetical protein
VVKAVRRLESLLKSHAQIQNNTIFLRRCSKVAIIPKGFRMEFLNTRFGSSKEILHIREELEKKLVKTTVKLNYKELQQLDVKIRELKIEIRRNVPEYWNWIVNLTNNSYSITKELVKEKQCHKLKTLIQEKIGHAYKDLNQKKMQTVHNLSSHLLSQNEEMLLQLGLNYSLPVKDIRVPMIDTAATIELKMLNLEMNEKSKDEVRSGISRIMRKHVTETNYKQPWDIWISKAIKSLQSDKSICICKADKGNSIVLLDKDDYNEKMNKMLQEGPYDKVPDPTTEFQNQVLAKCKELNNRKKISNNLYSELVIKDPRHPIIYGAPKIHKPSVPLRPIVDFRKSPTYKIASYISKLLKPLAANHKFTVKNSYDFVQDIKKVNPRCGDIKVSFDVVSLFTKVPIQETLEYIKWKLQNYDSLSDLTILDIRDIMELLKICLSSTYFNYQNDFYHQKEGTAMGSPVSPIVSELFLQSLENKLIMNDRHIYFWKRYVDDVFAITRRRHLQKLLEQLNSFHASIQFTVEEEKDGKLAFLDVMVYEKENRTLGYHVYKKSTHTDKYLNFHSYHPMPHKIGVTDTLLTRAFRLSDEEHLTEEIVSTINILEKNDYPEDFLLKRLKNVKEKINSPPQIPTTEKRVILPWAGIVTNKISQYLRRKLKIQLGYFPGPKLCTILCNAKQKPLKPKCGVYSITCKNCPSVYVGETERDFMIRINEHEQDIRRAAIKKSPVALHMHENGHELDPNSYKLILPEPRKYFRKFKESLYIKQATEKMNTSKGMPVNSLWSSTLLDFLSFPQ